MKFFHHIKLEAFCHATEDEKRVKKAMLNLLPFEEVDFEEEMLEGSFKNPITILRVHYEKQQEIKAVIENIKPRLDLSGFEPGEHIIDGTYFWMRFDKQAALDNRLEWGESDSIQFKGKVAAFPAKEENAIAVMEKLWKK
jgi:hypothetical protein